MRFRLSAAALAALAFATPAAAQPNALEVARSVVQRLDANVEGVQDYTLTLRSGAMSTDVYVYRDGDAWEVTAPDDDELGGMLESLVVWPTFGEMGDDFPMAGEVDAEALEELGDVFSVSSETLNGQPAHVLFLRTGELDMDDSEMPDSLRMFVDPATHQLLRVQVAGSGVEMGEFAPGGGAMEVSMDFSDYRETQGLTIPHALRMVLDVDLALTDQQKETMRQGVAAARAELAGEDSPEARQTAAMIDIFIGLLMEGHLELPVTVESVRVNAGPPSWFDG
jgi:hypothetical protein